MRNDPSAESHCFYQLTGSWEPELSERRLIDVANNITIICNLPNQGTQISGQCRPMQVWPILVDIQWQYKYADQSPLTVFHIFDDSYKKKSRRRWIRHPPGKTVCISPSHFSSFPRLPLSVSCASSHSHILYCNGSIYIAET